MTLRSLFLLAIAAGVAATLPALAQDPVDALPEGPGKAAFVKGCTACHQAQMVVARRRTADEWDEMVGKMVDRGAPLSEAEQDEVYAYLVANFAAPAEAAAPK